MASLKNFTVHPLVSQIIVYSILPLLIWVVLLLCIGGDDLPGGTIFALFIYECGGRLLGYCMGLVNMPPIVGMLGLGILVRNQPWVDFMQNWNPAVSPPIRNLALAMILSRAGFGLDWNTVVKYRLLVLRLSIMPTFFESTIVAVLTHYLLDFPWIWGFLVGFICAMVSPAVVVPRILNLKNHGYGEKAGVPTILLAAVSLDNVGAISMFGICLGFVFHSGSLSTVEMMAQCPLQLLAGTAFGLVWGLMNGFIFNPKKESFDAEDADLTIVKIFFIASGSVLSVFGFRLINYSAAGALGCVVSNFVTSHVWKKRSFPQSEIDQVKWELAFLWNFLEPLLFGITGAQVVISELDPHIVGLSIVCLIVGALTRFATAFGMASWEGLTVREKTFIAISWIPKTVQAAIGPVVLDHANESKHSDATTYQTLANHVLTIVVLIIILTAPIGEFLLIISGTRLLSRESGGDVEPNDLERNERIEEKREREGSQNTAFSSIE